MEYRHCPKCGRALEPRTLEGRERRVCPDPACGFVHYDNPTPVVAAVVQRGEDVLLVRSVGWPEKWFGLVSGFLEKDESPEAGMLREVKEELGLDGTIEGFIGAYAFTQMNQVILAYHVVVDGEVVLGEELSAYKVVPIDRLRPWALGTGRAVEDWLARRAAR